MQKFHCVTKRTSVTAFPVCAWAPKRHTAHCATHNTPALRTATARRNHVRSAVNTPAGERNFHENVANAKAAGRTNHPTINNNPHTPEIAARMGTQ